MYPLWADAVGWIIGLLPVAVIFFGALRQLCTMHLDLSLKDRLKRLLEPTSSWGPAGTPSFNLSTKCCHSSLDGGGGGGCCLEVADNSQANSSMLKEGGRVSYSTKVEGFARSKRQHEGVQI